MLHRIWLAFFVIGAFSALYQYFWLDNYQVFGEMVQSSFDMADLAVDLALGLIGVLAFWLGMVAIGEASGLIDKLSRALSPLFVRLMPGVPAGHKAISSVSLNLSANALGLDNAATPLGLKAMQNLQELNPKKDTASNAQILFLVLNTSSVTLFPITVLLYRAKLGATDPAAVFLPILFATSASTLTGLLLTAWVQKIKLRDTVLLAYFAAFACLLLSLFAYFASLSAEHLQRQSSVISNALILTLILSFLLVAHRRGVNVYDRFIEGAKQGFTTAVEIIPFILAMLVAIGMFRASGALALISDSLKQLVVSLGGDTRLVDVLPTALMKPLSGSGSRAMMLDTMNTYGVDSFQAFVAATVQGSTETTFYVLAVYFGAVGIRHTRHALACGLAADVAGISAAVVAAYWFYA